MRAHDIKISQEQYRYFKKVMEGYPKGRADLIRPYLTTRRFVLPLHLESVDFLLDLMADFCNNIYRDHSDNPLYLEREEARYGRMVRLIINRTWKLPEIGHIFGKPGKRGPKKRYKTKGNLT